LPTSFKIYPAENNDQPRSGHGQLPKRAQEDEAQDEEDQCIQQKADHPIWHFSNFCVLLIFSKNGKKKDGREMNGKVAYCRNLLYHNMACLT
jgi:hypothetical protein